MQDPAITTFPDTDKIQLTQFIDPYSDFSVVLIGFSPQELAKLGFGFKHIFGKIPNRDFLIKFLTVYLRSQK